MVGPINIDYFNGRTICITGNTGFKGAWLSFWLNQTGANLRGFLMKISQTIICSGLQN